MQPNATLSDRQARAATLEAMGHTTAQIADLMGVHRATLFRWRKDAAYRARVASILEDSQRAARAVLESASIQAAQRLQGLLSSEDDRVALRAATTILDRSGHGTTQRIDLSGVPRYPTEEKQDQVLELERLLSGMQAAAK